MKKILNKKRGFSLIELIVYISIMSVITIIIVGIVLVVIKSNKESFAKSKLNISAVSAIDRVNREIKNAKSITNSSASSVTLSSQDAGGGQRSVRVYLDSGIIKIDENGAYIGNLSSDDSYISALLFKYLDNSSSKAIRTEIGIKTNANASSTETFYTTAILRGSY